MDHRIELLDPRLDHRGQRLPRQGARRAIADAGNLDLLGGIREHLLGQSVVAA
jgi:hypothetical protein